MEDPSSQELHCEMVPGTIHLVDVQGILDVQKDKQNVILIPQPSSNINDPLRWSQTKKILQFALLWFWAFMLTVSVTFSGPLFDEWTSAFNISFNQLNIYYALSYLFSGIGCLVLQPTALKLGRRGVYLVCTIFVLVANVIGGVAKNVGFLYGNSILAGFACSPSDSLIEISATDVFFVHERSTVFGIIILAIFAGSYLGPVASGYIAQGTNWRWTFWVQVIIYGALFVVQLFLMEDTTFRRYSTEDELEKEILHTIKSHDSRLQSGKEDEEKAKISSDEVLVTNDESSIPKRTYWQKMKLIELEHNDLRPWLTIFARPFYLWSFPAILWGSLVYGAQIMWVSLIGTTQSEFYSAEPYNFTVAQVGLTNLGACVGAFIGMLYGGKFVDWLSITLARRNNGILEPEFRLWAMILPTILNAAGILAYGLPPYYGAKWEYSVIIGQGCLGFSMGSAGAICLTYAVDCYHNVASEALVLMLFLRNMIGTGFTFAIGPWIDRDGLKTTIWLMFMLSLIINGSFIFMIKYGKRFRKWTQTSYEKYSDPHYGAINLFKK